MITIHDNTKEVARAGTEKRKPRKEKKTPDKIYLSEYRLYLNLGGARAITSSSLFD